MLRWAAESDGIASAYGFPMGQDTEVFFIACDRPLMTALMETANIA
jgi:hypothetical protein